jgi:hypothetical protein
VVRGLRIYTANDLPQADPADYKLEGTKDGVNYLVISQGPLALPAERNPEANTFDPLLSIEQQILFTNLVSYSGYRLTFSNTKNNATANSLQIAELELLGYPAPVLTFERSGNNLTIRTTQAGQLQSASDVTATQWTNEGPITDSTTVPLNRSGQPKFYRVIIP